MAILVGRAAALLVLVAAVVAAEPWDARFAKDTTAISSAARALSIDGDPPAVILLEEHSYTIDRQGRITGTVRSVYLVRHRDDDQTWSSVQKEYQPWHQQRPKIQARVIAPSGAVSTLDPATIADAPASQFDASIYSDRRLVRAPLPGIEPGAVVEVEVVSSEIKTQLGGGSVYRVYVNQSVLLQKFRVSIDADRRIPVQAKTHGIGPDLVQKDVSVAGTQVRLELGPIPAVDGFEFNTPADQSSQKYLAFSTGRSWTDLAAAYAKIVEEKVASANVSALLEGLDVAGAPLDVAARITARLHGRVRYTGVEFGEAEIIPGNPAQTLARGYGDCKDKSTLLIALLRAAGLDAHVALLATGGQPDVEPDLPGLGLFDHAIVYVDTEPPFWIDATADDARVGVLPAAAEGRLALIAKPDATALVATPLSGSNDNWHRRTATIWMSDFGNGSMHEVTQAGGTLEATLRRGYATDPSAVRKAIEENAQKNLRGVLAKYEVSGRADFSTPFQILVEIDRVSAIATGMDDAAVSLLRADLFQNLPLALTWGLSDIPKDDGDERKSDVWFDYPHRAELQFRIHPPPQFKAVSLPETKDVALGPASYSQKVRLADDGSIYVSYELDTGKRRWSLEELKAFQAAAKPYLSEGPLFIRFIPRSAELIALGETGTALRELREYAETNPDNASAPARLSRLLIAAGLGDAADEHALRATQIAPDSAIAGLALSWAQQHDAFGRRFRGDYDRGEAVAALRKATELEPDLSFVSIELASLLEFDERGVRYGAGADLAESIKLYENLLEAQPLLPLRQRLISALLHAGRLEEAKDQVALGDPGIQNAFESLIKVLKDGAPALALDVQSRFQDASSRAQHLWNVGYSLMEMRRYDLALPLFQASARIHPDSGRQRFLQIFDRLRRHEDAAPSNDNPIRPVWAALVALMTDTGNLEGLKREFTSRDEWKVWKIEADALRKDLRRLKAESRHYGLDESLIIDFILSSSNLGSEGEESRGFRIHSDTLPTFFVVRENGEYRILGSSFNMAEVGKLVWKTVDDGDLDGARWWLDQAVLAASRRTDNRIPPAQLLWSGVTDEGRGPAIAKVAAAAYVGSMEKSDLAIQILRDTARKATVSLEKNQANVALADAFVSAKEWVALAEVARELGGTVMFASEGFDYALQAARAGGDWQKLAGFARARLSKEPSNNNALRALAEASAYQNDLNGLEKSCANLLGAEFVSSDDLIFDAWMRRIVGQADEDRLHALQKKVESYRDPGAEFYYTQAMMQAELAQPDEAMKSLRLAMADQDPAIVGPKIWLIQARLSELYGFPDAAELARQRARSAVAGDDIDRWALAALDVVQP